MLEVPASNSSINPKPEILPPCGTKQIQSTKAQMTKRTAPWQGVSSLESLGIRICFVLPCGRVSDFGFWEDDYLVVLSRRTQYGASYESASF